MISLRALIEGAAGWLETARPRPGLRGLLEFAGRLVLFLVCLRAARRP